MSLHPEPLWSPDDHLPRVYRRGRQLRRRRQAGATAGALAAILAVAGVARGLTGDTGGRRIATSPGTTTLSTTTLTPTPSETTAPATTVTPPTALIIPNGPATTARRTTTTTGRVVPQPTAATSATTTTASPCPPSALRMQTTTDHSAYGPGQKVVVSLVVTNPSSQPCTGPGTCGIRPSASAFGPTPGRLAWHQNGIAIACVAHPPPPPVIPPAGSHTYSDVAEWDRTGDTSPPGPYQAVVDWLGPAAAPAPFTLTG